MSDSISPEHRSWNMSQIHGKDTSIEVKVRKYLFSQGFRFRKNVKNMPGKPDIVLPKYKSVVFIQGCFWHRHEGCKRATFPKSNTEYWQKKFDRNTANDRHHNEELRNMGWNVITIWECEINNNYSETVKLLVDRIRSVEHNV